MPFKHKFIEPILLLRWEPNFEPQDAELLKEILFNTHRLLKQPVILFSIIPQTTSHPPRKARLAIAGTLRAYPEKWKSMHVLLEGRGIRIGLFRTMVAGIILAVPGLATKIILHNDPQEAFTAIAKQSQISQITLHHTTYNNQFLL